jgi:hypothetical protein
MRKEKLWHGSTSSLFPTVDTEVMRKPMMTLLLFTLGHSVIREKRPLLVPLNRFDGADSLSR